MNGAAKSCIDSDEVSALKSRQILKYLTGASCILVLIFDSKTAVEGAMAGIDLCLKTVVPSLFPLMVLTTWLTGLLSGSQLRFLRPLRRICRLPEGTEPILLSGFLGGYPVGAQCIAQAYQAKQISKSDAQRMLAFCCNTGPSFLFGVAGSLFSHHSTAWLLWGIHILSALLTASLISCPGEPIQIPAKSEITLPGALQKSVSAMGIICGWILLFRIVLCFLERWFFWYLPEETSIILSGFLELSNGCFALSKIPSEELRFVLCAGFLAFGGICVVMQTMGVTQGLSLRYYFLGKALQTFFSLLISTLFVLDYRFSFFVCFIMVAVVFYIRQKKSSVPVPVGV